MNSLPDVKCTSGKYKASDCIKVTPDLADPFFFYLSQ